MRGRLWKRSQRETVHSLYGVPTCLLPQTEHPRLGSSDQAQSADRHYGGSPMSIEGHATWLLSHLPPKCTCQR